MEREPGKKFPGAAFSQPGDRCPAGGLAGLLLLGDPPHYPSQTQGDFVRAQESFLGTRRLASPDGMCGGLQSLRRH